MKEIIKFKGKNSSWFKDLNLLCKENNIYVMDNHNAALWCWPVWRESSRRGDS